METVSESHLQGARQRAYWSEEDTIRLVCAVKTVENSMSDINRRRQSAWKWQQVAILVPNTRMSSLSEFPRLCREKFEKLRSIFNLVFNHNAERPRYFTDEVFEELRDYIQSTNVPIRSRRKPQNTVNQPLIGCPEVEPALSSRPVHRRVKFQKESISSSIDGYVSERRSEETNLQMEIVGQQGAEAVFISTDELEQEEYQKRGLELGKEIPLKDTQNGSLEKLGERKPVLKRKNGIPLSDTEIALQEKLRKQREPNRSLENKVSKSSAGFDAIREMNKDGSSSDPEVPIVALSDSDKDIQQQLAGARERLGIGQPGRRSARTRRLLLTWRNDCNVSSNAVGETQTIVGERSKLQKRQRTYKRAAKLRSHGGEEVADGRIGGSQVVPETQVVGGTSKLNKRRRRCQPTPGVGSQGGEEVGSDRKMGDRLLEQLKVGFEMIETRLDASVKSMVQKYFEIHYAALQQHLNEQEEVVMEKFRLFGSKVKTEIRSMKAKQDVEFATLADRIHALESAGSNRK